MCPKKSKGILFMYDRIRIKEAAKEKLRNNYGMVLGVTIVSGIILGALASTGIGTLLVGGPIAVGVAIIMLEIIRGQKNEFADMFKGFNNFGSAFVMYLLTGIFVFLWSLLFVIPGIVKALAYSMAPYILADHPEMSGNEAITASKNMMQGHKGELFCLYLSFIGWLLLSALTFGLLQLFYVGPYMAVAEAEFYEAIKPAETYAAPQETAEPQI